jgi:isoleucyl-tRNA synthetase
MLIPQIGAVKLSLSLSHPKLVNFRGTTSFTRRSCQTVLAAHLLSIVRVIAPLLPHLAEDAWQNLPFHYTIEDGSIAEFVFESRWPTLNETWLAFPTKEIGFWTKVLEVILFLFNDHKLA